MNHSLDLKKYILHLREEEKSKSTVEQYEREVQGFLAWLDTKEHVLLTKEVVLEYRQILTETYVPVTVNCKLAALNSYFTFLGMPQLKVKKLKCQRQIYQDKNRELSHQEYMALLRQARKTGHTRLYWVMQTICSCGIRISELKFITVEALKKCKVMVQNKGKSRTICLPDQLCRDLHKYSLMAGIRKGSIFITRGGKTLDRSNIWSQMKSLCKKAGVAAGKVFPHNLRHLFAITFYKKEKDLGRLADILGHASIDTTRIYTAVSIQSVVASINQLGLMERRDQKCEQELWREMESCTT